MGCMVDLTESFGELEFWFRYYRSEKKSPGSVFAL